MIRESIRQIRQFIHDPEKDLKDRSFILFSATVLCALFAAVPCGLIMHEPLSATISTFAGALFFAIYVSIAFKKNKIERARIVISVVLVVVFLPLMFFTNGGVNGGAPVWMILACLYVVMTLDGKIQLYMSLLNVVILIICWVIGYFFPSLVTEYSREGNYIDTLAAIIIVSNVSVILIGFQTRMYIRENELARDKTKELEELNRSQSRFFSSMSHEIRTPINTVLGLNEIILRQEDASDEIKKDARNIQGAGKMLLALINDILDVSKIEAGKMDIVPVAYDVSSLLSEIVNMIWLKAEEKGLEFKVDIDPNVPQTLFGDEVRIKQILINLLNNAVKYTMEGSVSLHMECEREGDNSVLLNIVIEDTGMGIKPEALPHLFDTFKRVDEEKNRYIEGTGLGLSIVKQLVELMDGEISVNSVYTQGSTFAVMLKQGISSDKAVGDINITNLGDIAGGERFEHLFRASDASALIVDDNEMNLEVERKLLEGTGLAVELAKSGAEALKMTGKKHYDIIFMDHLMPEMDGIECYGRIRNQEGGLNRSVPVIVLTANAGSENMELYNNTGFDGYLVKPVSGKQLEEMIVTHLPENKVVLNNSGEMTGSSIRTAGSYTRKKAVAIATSSMCDLPHSVLEELQIDTIPYTVSTSEGVFYDNIDIDSEELVRYMQDTSKFVTSEPPTEEDLIDFFSAELKKAHHVIYITLTTGSSREYGRAVKAADTFENVYVVNSECLSSATGILAMAAAKLAEQKMPVEKIIAELEEVKELIKCSFVIRNTDVMARRGHLSPFMNNVLKSLWLRPMLRTKNDRLGVGRLLFGSEKKCYEKYMKHALPYNVYPDKSFIFVTYAGMDESELQWIEKKLNEWIRFDHIVFRKASAGITSNCGGGTFGLIYMIRGNKNYNLGTYFENQNADNDIKETDNNSENLANPDNDELEYNDGPNNSSDTIQNGSASDKWYDSISFIDSVSAIKNSGSEEAFLSVLKIYYDSYKAKSDEINEYYNAGDWENYTIKVHALKSSSRLVGALKIGDDAEKLEDAGKAGDVDYITEHHDELMSEYSALIEELKLSLRSEDDRPDIPPDVLTDAYGGLMEFSETMDYELARMVMDSVNEYKLPVEDEDRFERINAKLMVMDWNAIKRILKEREQ